MARSILAGLLAGLLGGCAASPPPYGAVPDVATQRPAYRLYIANESSDLVSRVAFHPDSGLWREKDIPVGLMPTDNDGAHGIAVSPDGRHWYLSIAHGTPFGTVWRFRTGADTLEGRAELGLFPATMALSPDGSFLLAANFNLHGDPIPSSISVVHTPTMTEITKVTTCVMPHGSRVSADGRYQYSACMRSDQLVQVDLADFQVKARLSLVPGAEGPLPLSQDGGSAVAAPGCAPTWAQPGRGARAHLVYVPCNRAAQVLEVDPVTGSVSRRLATGNGPYNLDVTPDGNLLVVTLKGDQAIGIFDLNSGTERARLATSRPVSHGVVVGPAGRYAFVTNESVGSDRGTLDVVDLSLLEVVESIELGHQPGGVGLWDPATGQGGSR